MKQNAKALYCTSSGKPIKKYKMQQMLFHNWKFKFKQIPSSFRLIFALGIESVQEISSAEW